jgi:TetR/AcrR family transcriptional regulator, transcriptional repressor for nem operon
MSTNRKQELIQSAIGMISERGYDSFSFADLARVSGITKASIHHHFVTKEAMGLAVLGCLESMMQAQIERLQTLSAADAMTDIIKQATLFPWHARICTLTSLHAEYNVLPDQLQQRLQAISTLEEQSLAELLQRYSDESGTPLNLPVTTAARVLISAAKGALLYGRTQQVVWARDVVGGALLMLGVRLETEV